MSTMTANRVRLRESHPDLFFLDPAEPELLERYLRLRGLLTPEQVVLSVARAGDGNMNCTVRVSTRAGSLIIKQARPWVEKYPQFAAPWDRACREAEFYRAVTGEPEVINLMPRLIDFDPEARVLVLEDLGVASDFTGLYRGDALVPGEIDTLARFLSTLHRHVGKSASQPPLANREMRDLNHAHVFQIPLTANNGLDLDAITQGLAAEVSTIRADDAYVREVTRLGREVYQADGNCLLHGDFYPGSLLRTASGPRVIDPEFGHFGFAEFDVGVFLAHLLLSAQSPDILARWRREYLAPPGFDDALMFQLAGVEIMRRLIGYAQLPIGYGLDRKRELLGVSRVMVLEPQLWMQAVG